MMTDDDGGGRNGDFWMTSFVNDLIWHFNPTYRLG